MVHVEHISGDNRLVVPKEPAKGGGARDAELGEDVRIAGGTDEVPEAVVAGLLLSAVGVGRKPIMGTVPVWRNAVSRGGNCAEGPTEDLGASSARRVLSRMSVESARVVLVLDVPKPRQAPVMGRSRARRGFERLRRQGKGDRAGGCGARRARGIGLLDGLPLTRGRHPRLCGAPADAVGGQGVTMPAW